MKQGERNTHARRMEVKQMVNSYSHHGTIVQIITNRHDVHRTTVYRDIKIVLQFPCK